MILYRVFPNNLFKIVSISRTIGIVESRQIIFNYNISVVLFCLAAVLFPMGFYIDEIGGQPYQLPNSHQVGISYILFVLSLWITVISELFAGKVCLPHF